MSRAYYSEWDPYAAEWLRNLIAEGLIADGDVDQRSITDIHPSDLSGYTQCHFFAGIGGWSMALRLAAWRDSRPVWSGSCPCQPFSSANTLGAKGRSDERHLWPAFFRLIRECRPPVVFGEQVAGAVEMGWLDEAFGDLEPEGYACAAVVLRAVDVGADHERRRLFWCADAMRPGRKGYQPNGCISVRAGPPQSISGDTFAELRRAMAGDHSGLLRGDGLPVSVERCAAKGYGNAIVPQVAANVIAAFMDTTQEQAP